MASSLVKRRATRGRKSAVGVVYDAIVDSVVTGQLGGNERLTEARLSGELGVGRGAVREAMNKLAADGVIELIPNKGAVVRVVTRKDVSDFFQVRGIFESFAARRAAQRINESGVRELALDLVDEIERIKAHPDREAFVAHDENFHAGIMDSSDNSILAAEWRRLRRSRHRTSFLQRLTEEQILVSLDQHLGILKAILAGDDAAAAELGWRHVGLTSGRVQNLPNKEFTDIYSPRSAADVAGEPGDGKPALRAVRRSG